MVCSWIRGSSSMRSMEPMSSSSILQPWPYGSCRRQAAQCSTRLAQADPAPERSRGCTGLVGMWVRLCACHLTTGRAGRAGVAPSCPDAAVQLQVPSQYHNGQSSMSRQAKSKQAGQPEAGWRCPHLAGMYSPSAVVLPSPHVYKNALVVGEITCTPDSRHTLSPCLWRHALQQVVMQQVLSLVRHWCQSDCPSAPAASQVALCKRHLLDDNGKLVA